MARSLPYFKFTPGEWMTGDIVFESFEVQGLFINICALYWQREGVLTISDINNRYKKPKALHSLLNRFISIDEIDPNIVHISFLDEQFTERKIKSEINSGNGSLGGRPKKPKNKDFETETKPNALFEEAKKSNIEEEEEQEKEEEREFKDDSISVFGFLKRPEAKAHEPQLYEFIERYFNLLETILPNDKKVINRDFELKRYSKPAREILKYYSFEEIKWVFGVIIEDPFWHTNIFNLESIQSNWQQIKLKGKERERSKA